MEGETIRMKKKSETQVEQEKKKLAAWLRAVIPESYDKFDLEAEYDSSLDYLENKNIITDKLRTMMPDDFKGASKKEQKEIVRVEQERISRVRDEQIEKEILEYNKKTYVQCKELDGYYKKVTRATKKICQGFSNLAFIKGRGGIGKSWQIRKVLIEGKADYVEIAGDVTEAFLYRLLYENNGKIIWFRDVAKLLKGLSSMNLLKAACESEGKRLLTKSNYSKKQNDLDNKFFWTGKIIFDYNETAGLQLKEDFEALQTRGDYIELTFSMDDMYAVMNLIAQDGWQLEVTRYLLENYEFTGQNLINLRTQWKAFMTYKYAQKNKLDWKEELKDELESSISRARGMLYSLIGNKAVRTAELKKLLLRYGIVNTVRTADNRINAWIVAEEIYKVSEGKKNYYICLNPVTTVQTE